MKEEKFPHTRKPLHWQRWGVAGEKIRSHGGERSNRGAEGKAERFLHRGSVPSSTHQPEKLICSRTGAGGGQELRLQIHRSDLRERTGVGCMNTPEGGECSTASWEAVQKKVWNCLRDKTPLFQGTRGRGIQSIA